nr:hypothetical protein GCM10020092_073390 [Actinoplanes digitatis]
MHVQEDFNYHAALYANDTHPQRTPTSGLAAFGDGLNTLSDYPYSDLFRDDWDACNGTDCLTPKGFTWSRTRLAEGVLIDFYNVHANAGSADGDLSARRANISELSAFIAANSASNAVVVAGDTNTRYTRAGDNIRDLLTANGLTDAWVEEERGGVPMPAIGSPSIGCDDAAVTDACEVVDKILYRGNRYITLDLERYGNENAGFRRADGAMLSDHYPIAAEFGWTLNPDLSLSDATGGPHGTPFTDVAAVPLGRRVAQVGIRAGSPGRPGVAHPGRRDALRARRRRWHRAEPDAGRRRVPDLGHRAYRGPERADPGLRHPLRHQRRAGAVGRDAHLARRHLPGAGGMADQRLPRPLRRGTRQDRLRVHPGGVTAGPPRPPRRQPSSDHHWLLPVKRLTGFPLAEIE